MRANDKEGATMTTSGNGLTGGAQVHKSRGKEGSVSGSRLGVTSVEDQ